MNRYFKYILLVTFLAAVLVIVFLQFNSNRSINQLIGGNEDLLEELTIKNNLQQLQTGIVTLENKVRGTVIGGLAIDSNHLQQETDAIQLSLLQLDTLQSDAMIDPLLTELKRLVNSKIGFNRNVLDMFTLKGKVAAEQLINMPFGKLLTDSIKIKALQIDDLHRVAVTALIREADNNGRKAKTLGSIMALIAAFASVFTFGYVSYKIRQQQELITKLNASEKKVREIALVKENFLANMSHEIRTPMNAILGFTNLLQRKTLDSESKHYVQSIRKSGENLLTIINDILDLSKIEAGMMRIESAPFSIRSLVHSIETMFKTKAGEKQLELTSFIDEHVPDILEGDATRLTQILVNLIGNALKFTNRGSIKIKISNEGNTQNTVNTGITVIDTGIGIEKEKLQYIFERFQQAEDSVTRKYGGTGLGLAIVNDLVLLQHGSIAVESEPGEGTTFRLLIPYKISAEQFDTASSASLSQNLLTDQTNFENVCVLVVEDNEINQSLIQHLFSIWHLEFDLACNGREAIDKLSTKKYSLILMDIQMPEMDGYTAAQEIRNTLKSDIPIIAMTAHALAGEREKCLSYGMNEYISKPIREEQLHQLIARFTQLNRIPVLQKKSSAQYKSGEYQYINLQYMKDVSGGNVEYEKIVTEQFMEAIPEDLLTLENAWQNNDINRLRQVAHDMKTSVSVMGLDEGLHSYLDNLENETLDEESFKENFLPLKLICNVSLAEASQFYLTL
jgi:signal transduction histidine kinase/CheY-like chemotaxis protein